jgi:hypothetical protein
MDIDAADIMELCVWCHLKPDFTHMICNFTRVPDFRTVVYNFEIYAHYRSPNSEQGWYNTRPILTAFASHQQVNSWITVLCIASHLEATDPRDYIYALLGCPSAHTYNNASLVHADYTITKAELYTRVAKILIQHPTEGPWVLCAMQTPQREHLLHHGSPSWVPKWDANSPIYRTASTHYWYRAGGPEHLFQPKLQANDVLKLRGILFDRIVWMSEVLIAEKFRNSEKSHDSGQDGPANVPYVDTLWDELHAQASRSGTGLRSDDFFLTLVQGYAASRSSKEIWHDGSMQAYRKYVESKLRDVSDQAQLTLQEKIDAVYYENQLVRSNDLRIVLTLKGRVGMVPNPSVRIGDTCCIFFGVSVPFILVNSNPGCYKLAGQAYIHGVMGGAVLDRYEASDILLE